mmetsp:Transcript_5720/g.12595  ORF Transcript_5720/g.12595 Transcript_5720/m.12595 type:complete len:200 (-) Transcript_5720:63-662(-)
MEELLAAVVSSSLRSLSFVILSCSPAATCTSVALSLGILACSATTISAALLPVAQMRNMNPCLSRYSVFSRASCRSVSSLAALAPFCSSPSHALFANLLRRAAASPIWGCAEKAICHSLTGRCHHTREAVSSSEAYDVKGNFSIIACPHAREPQHRRNSASRLALGRWFTSKSFRSRSAASASILAPGDLRCRGACVSH